MVPFIKFLYCPGIDGHIDENNTDGGNFSKYYSYSIEERAVFLLRQSFLAHYVTTITTAKYNASYSSLISWLRDEIDIQLKIASGNAVKILKQAEAYWTNFMLVPEMSVLTDGTFKHVPGRVPQAVALPYIRYIKDSLKDEHEPIDYIGAICLYPSQIIQRVVTLTMSRPATFSFDREDMKDSGFDIDDDVLAYQSGFRTKESVTSLFCKLSVLSQCKQAATIIELIHDVVIDKYHAAYINALITIGEYYHIRYSAISDLLNLILYKQRLGEMEIEPGNPLLALVSAIEIPNTGNLTSILETAKAIGTGTVDWNSVQSSYTIGHHESMSFKGSVEQKASIETFLKRSDIGSIKADGTLIWNGFSNRAMGIAEFTMGPFDPKAGEEDKSKNDTSAEDKKSSTDKGENQTGEVAASETEKKSGPPDKSSTDEESPETETPEEEVPEESDPEAAPVSPESTSEPAKKDTQVERRIAKILGFELKLVGENTLGEILFKDMVSDKLNYLLTFKAKHFTIEEQQALKMFKLLWLYLVDMGTVEQVLLKVFARKQINLHA